MRRFLQWSHNFNSELIGTGRNLRISVPLHPFSPGDKVKLESCVWNEEFKSFVIKATLDECPIAPATISGNISELSVENVPSITGLLGGRKVRQ